MNNNDEEWTMLKEKIMSSIIEHDTYAKSSEENKEFMEAIMSNIREYMLNIDGGRQ